MKEQNTFTQDLVRLSNNMDELVAMIKAMLRREINEKANNVGH